MHPTKSCPIKTCRSTATRLTGPLPMSRQYLVVCTSCECSGPKRPTVQQALLAWDKEFVREDEASEPYTGSSTIEVDEATGSAIIRLPFNRIQLNGIQSYSVSRPFHGGVSLGRPTITVRLSGSFGKMETEVHHQIIRPRLKGLETLRPDAALIEQSSILLCIKDAPNANHCEPIVRDGVVYHRCNHCLGVPEVVPDEDHCWAADLQERLYLKMAAQSYR